MIYVLSMAGGFLIGLVIGRWWAVLAGVAFGAWVGVTTGVDEVPHWLLGLIYGVLAASGIALGIMARRALRSPAA